MDPSRRGRSRATACRAAATWIVAARQDKDPRAFGRNFTEWASMTPNLQAEILLSSAMAGAFERGRATKTTPCLGRCTTPRALDARLGCTPRMHAWDATPTFPQTNTAEYGKLAYFERTVWLTPTGIHPHHRYLQANTASYWKHFSPSGIILCLPPQTVSPGQHGGIREARALRADCVARAVGGKRAERHGASGGGLARA